MPSPISPSTVTAQVKIRYGDLEIEAGLTVPKAPVARRMMLPLVRSVADSLIGSVVEKTVQSGRSISCKAGCGACCRQLVPITYTEAWELAELVEKMPEPKRSEVRERFRQAVAKLKESGVYEKLQQSDQNDKYKDNQLGYEYFRLGIPCPFLEDESCSIHPHRPIVCREYLVTSDPEHCKLPTADKVDMVELPASIWTALARMDGFATKTRRLRYVPLTLLLEWVEQHPHEPPLRAAPELVQEFFQYLTGDPVPAPRFGAFSALVTNSTTNTTHATNSSTEPDGSIGTSIPPVS